MKFDIDNYPRTQGRYAMHCDTEEKANIFLEHLDSLGLCWSSGDSYLRKNLFNNARAYTCYFFNGGVVGDTRDYIPGRITILEFDDFEWDNPVDISFSFDELMSEERNE